MPNQASTQPHYLPSFDFALGAYLNFLACGAKYITISLSLKEILCLIPVAYHFLPRIFNNFYDYLSNFTSGDWKYFILGFLASYVLFNSETLDLLSRFAPSPSQSQPLLAP